MSYATAEDVQSRWRTLTSAEYTTADVLCADVSARIDALNSDIAERVSESESFALLVCSVVCAVVQRAMSAGDAFGVSQQSQTVGSFTQQLTYSNPSGDIYFTKAERQLLALSAQSDAYGGAYAGEYT